MAVQDALPAGATLQHLALFSPNEERETHAEHKQRSSVPLQVLPDCTVELVKEVFD